MSGLPLPTIPGESAAEYRLRLAAWDKGRPLTQQESDVARCPCGCSFVIQEYEGLIREVLRAGNANTRAIKELMRQAGTSWAKRARSAIGARRR